MARSTLSRFFVLPIKGALGPSHQCYALSGHFLESGLGVFLGSEKVEGHPTHPPSRPSMLVWTPKVALNVGLKILLST